MDVEHRVSIISLMGTVYFKAYTIVGSLMGG
jgi:hypothetical protein